MNFFRSIFTILIAISSCGIAFGQFGSEANHDPATLRSEVSSIAPGESFTLSIEYPNREGWHSYYKNSGGIEEPMEAEWNLPDGFKVGPAQYPTPTIFESPLGKSIGYSGSPILLFEITPPKTLEVGDSVKLDAKAVWQTCLNVCVNADTDLSLTLPVAEKSEVNSDNINHFENARASIPKLMETWVPEVVRVGKDITLRLESKSGGKAPAEISFIPDQVFIAPVEFTEPTVENETLVLPLSQAIDQITDEPLEIEGDAISGIVLMRDSAESEVTSLRFDEQAFSKPPVPPLPFSKFLPVLGGMLLGGLILNLMPCVFPVIGLKIMGFVQQAGEDRKKIVMHGLAFVVGVLISFWVLSGILFVVRETTTTEISWGYQLQNKWFVYGLVMLFWVFGLSMYGLFEIGSSATSVGGNLQAKKGMSGSFFSGILATVAATPCSAPFLGPAIGVALPLPAVQFFSAFTAMALGLALPYLILSIFPKLVDLLPRPGAWMESFKQGMAFLLIGSAAYFLWVYTDHVVEDVLFLVFIGFVLIAMAFWVYGRWDTPAKKARTRWIGRIVSLLILSAGIYLSTGPYNGLKWERWSQGKVDQYLAEGRPVYVDFTAKWCATCQSNKRIAYTDEVKELFESRGIVALKADKTLPDPDIDAKVAELGRAAIPVNVLYVPGKDPIVTPEILTSDYMKTLINEEVPATKP